MNSTGEIYHQVKSEGVVEGNSASGLEVLDDLETSGSKNDGCTDPETTVG